MSISSVTSEALQLKLRQLLPSQQGFGTDLSASDTIIPIIDLTASAEGSDVRQDLQTALAFGSQTAFNTNTSVTIINSTGFFRIIGTASLSANQTVSVNPQRASFDMTDGATVKRIWALECQPQGATDSGIVQIAYDFVVYLNAGESIDAVCKENQTFMAGSTRQIADINGTLVQPVGFTPQ